MKKTKKGIILGLIILGIIILCISIPVYNTIKQKQESAINTASFKIKNINCSKGEEINVEIELLNDSDFVAANFEYKYDGTNLEYNNYEVGDSLKDGAMTIVNNDKEKQKIMIGYVAKPEGDKLIKSGKIIDIKFKVKNNITSNQIKNEFDCTTLKKEDGTDIKYKIQQAIIDVK